MKHAMLLAVVLTVFCGGVHAGQKLVLLSSVDPTIKQGASTRCLVTKETAKRLSIAHKQLQKKGTALKVHKCYEGGNAVDVTTEFDHFGPRSGMSSMEVSAETRKNRNKLQEVMGGNGFRSSSEHEWWHYQLENESIPTKSFDNEVD